MAVIHFDQKSFDEQVLAGQNRVLVDFWAPWCGPCKMLGPIIEELSGELEGEVVVGKIDVDAQPDLAARYGVMTIPTVILFDKGQEVKRTVGAQPKASLMAFLK